MNNKDFKNLQDSLYNSILPPPESLKPSWGKCFEACKSLDITADWSDSEHTKFLQDRNNGSFKMTQNRHPEASTEVSYCHPCIFLRLFIFLCSFSFFLAIKRKKMNQKKEKNAVSKEILKFSKENFRSLTKYQIRYGKFSFLHLKISKRF